MFKQTVTLMLSAAAMAGLAGCNWDSRADESSEPYYHRVGTIEVQLQSGFDVEREFAGEVRAGQRSELGFEFPGQVASLAVDVGDSVSAGQLLAQLDTQLLETERVELGARREETLAELDTTRQNLARIKRLQVEKLASERELDELTGRARVLEASIARIDAALQANQVRFDKSGLRAPFDAIVAARRVDSGAVVDAGAPVFGLVQEGVREVRSGVPSRLAESLETGKTVWLSTGDDRIEGRVISVGPVVDQATRSRTVRVRLNEDWAPGALAYLALEVPVQTEGAWLPDSAVTHGARGTWVVYAVVDAGDGHSRLEPRSVVIHHATGNELYVSGALEGGEHIVAAGLHRLAPGQVVRPIEQATLADAR
ncbi:MAG: efflux RND transporter periplasmic adaptor subunit [Gammaproteobacteria bacterium]|nr:efflux RND transporter periplasmic adaptor subunit [Gammaproteobacteria bacterium]NNJ79618.1 efflux RND transporter periplasmic adaptor subunit [Xanthomonadales bacterium]